MVKQLSYTKFENEILPDFRQKLNMAESTEDVRKFFFQTVRQLFERIFEEKAPIRFEDLALQVNEDQTYKFADPLFKSRKFQGVWKDTDLPNVMDRLAKAAVNRHKRLSRNPEKTDSKIRM